MFAFRLMPYLLGLFHWGVGRVSKLGAMSKRKSCKFDRIVWKMHASGAILEHLFFDIASNIVSLHTFVPDNHNK